MILLSLDMSSKCTGWAVFSDGKYVDSGVIKEPSYRGKSADRYPQRAARVGALMAAEVFKVVQKYDPDKIIAEEIEVRGLQGVKSVKSLAAFHGMFMLTILDYISKLEFIAPTTWRSKIKLKKNGDWKLSAVKMVRYLLNMELSDSDHDRAEAILIGYSLFSK